MDICFFGGYDRDYPRNAVLRRGLGLAGVSVSECHVRPGRKFWLRYPRLAAERLSQERRGHLFVPEFCQKDVPLARLFALSRSRRVVFDPLASRFETKFVDWGWRSPSSLAAWWNRQIDGLAFRLSDLILADTAAHRDYYVRRFGLPPDKFAVVPVGFDDRVFSREVARAGQAARAARPPGSPFTAVFFGSFLPLHGVDSIIEAAAGVWKRDKNIRFLMIGGGRTLPVVKARAAELGLGNVHFQAWQGPAALAGTVAFGADACLGIFGRTEKAARVVPHKVFQAMAMGKAVVTARTPAVTEFFEHGRDIFLCDTTRPGSLEDALLTLKENADLRESIARRGCELVWEKFHPAALGAALHDILEQRMGTGKARGQVRAGDRPGSGPVPIKIDGYRGMISAACHDRVFLEALAPVDRLRSREGAEVLSEGRNLVVRLPLPLSSGDVADIIVKEFPSRGVNALKSLLQRSKAERSWRGAAALVGRGLGTATPVAWLARRKHGFVERSYFLAERVAGAAEVRGLFRELPNAAFESLLEALAAFLSSVHDKGILHRDLSDGNVLARKTASEGFRFFLLDTNRIRIRRRLGRLARAKNLIRLGIPASHRDHFLAAYFGGRPPALPLFWYRLNKSVFTHYLALKRRLRLRRLARALRIQ